MRVIFGILIFFFSLSSHAQGQQCFEVFSLDAETAFRDAQAINSAYAKENPGQPNAYVMWFPKPEFGNFLKVYDSTLAISEKMPKEMPEDLLYIAVGMADNWAPAVPFLVRIFTELYDPNRSRETSATIERVYDAMAHYGIYGAQVLKFEELIQGKITRGIELINEDSPLLKELKKSGVQ